MESATIAHIEEQLRQLPPEKLAVVLDSSPTSLSESRAPNCWRRC